MPDGFGPQARWNRPHCIWLSCIEAHGSSSIRQYRAAGLILHMLPHAWPFEGSADNDLRVKLIVNDVVAGANHLTADVLRVPAATEALG